MRKSTPDILSQLTREKHKDINTESNKGINAESNKDIHVESHKSISIENHKDTKTQKHKVIKKVRVTFSMSADIVDELEKCWMKIRQLKKSKGISRSDIVEVSLKGMVDEFWKDRENSKLFKDIV